MAPRIILKRAYNMLPNQIELAQPVVQLGFGQDFYVGSVTQFLDFCEPNIFALIYIMIPPAVAAGRPVGARTAIPGGPWVCGASPGMILSVFSCCARSA